MFYWRSVAGKEVDFVIEHGRKVLAVEVKSTRNPVFHDIKNLLVFVEEHPEAVRGVLLHAGDSIRHFHSKIIAVPWWWIA